MIMKQNQAFTMVEVVAALVILASVMVLVAQFATWSFRERWRNSAQEAAVELAANVMETARAQPWQDLTPNWAAQQTLPNDAADLLPEGKLAVVVEAEKSLPRLKRVTVTVQWRIERNVPLHAVELVHLVSDRSAPKGEGKP